MNDNPDPKLVNYPIQHFHNTPAQALKAAAGILLQRKHKHVTIVFHSPLPDGSADLEYVCSKMSFDTFSAITSYLQHKLFNR